MPMGDFSRRASLKYFTVATIALVTNRVAGPHTGIITTALAQAPAGRGGQPQDRWLWCRKCEGLWFSGNATAGACPAGGGHERAGSSNYRVFQADVPGAQRDWRWCSKCQGLWFAGNSSEGTCPARGGHVNTGSSDYRVLQVTTPPAGTQANWRWCDRCQGLWFGASGNLTGGVCPAGGSHNGKGSGNYALLQ